MKTKVFSFIIASAVLYFTSSGLFSGKMYAEGKDIAEIVSLRSEYGKQFTNDDGTITSYVNTVPIDKTTCVYNTWFYDGHNPNSTGTSFVCLD